MECVDMTILRFWIFRQNSILENVRPDFSSEGHFWVVRHIFSSEKSIYGSYGPISFGPKSIYGSYGPYISWKSPWIWVVSQVNFWKDPLYGSSVKPISEKGPYIWVVSQVNFWKDPLHGVVSQVNFWKGSLYMNPQSIYFWWVVHIVVLWVSELILWVS